MKAPEFPAGSEWLGVDKPIRMSYLRGKVVLLDFWTYCCINCMHIIPDLKRLEAEFPEELVVIGVHSAKFTQERETDNIRQAMLRYEIRHPVVNDRDFQVWRNYSARAWPTVVLIDPEGRIVLQAAGEGVYARFRDHIGRLVETYRAKGEINHTPVPFTLDAHTAPGNLLAFPGKVLADAAGGRLFISDQNNNRIVICELPVGRAESSPSDTRRRRSSFPAAATVIDVIGSGSNGFRDGGFDQAAFNHPQGMALGGNVLYIADTENHALRAADLNAREVTTLAGTGRQMGFGGMGGRGPQTDLSSPWDLALRGETLYIAMAGTHQIWTLDLTSGDARPFAGSGHEGISDGSRADAWLAQPSGLALEGDRLYFADSEVSAIRYVEIDPPRGRTGTLVGHDLFEFGDEDGKGDDASLQHPLGVAASGDLVYVADTYNGKIKTIDPASRETRTLFTGVTGEDDKISHGKSRFYEPGGIDIAQGILYIADTNNHRICAADLATGAVREIVITDAQHSCQNDVIRVGAKSVGVGRGSIRVEIALNDEWKLNPGSDIVLALSGNPQIASPGGRIALTAENPRSLSLPVVWSAGTDALEIELDYTVCKSGDAAVCVPYSRRVVIAVTATPNPEITKDLFIRIAGIPK